VARCLPFFPLLNFCSFFFCMFCGLHARTQDREEMRPFHTTLVQTDTSADRRSGACVGWVGKKEKQQYK
jgi:hypothetical protein